MKKVLKRPLFLMALLGLFSTLLIASHTGDTIIVDDDSVECPDAHFDNISDAEDHASPGETIHVCPGVYNEQVFVETSDIDIVGDDGAILDGTGTAGRAAFLLESSPASAAPADEFWVEKVTITGFEIRNYQNTDPGQGVGIRAFPQSTKEITVLDNWIHDVRWAGVWAGNADGAALHEKWIVDNNVIEDVGPLAGDDCDGFACGQAIAFDNCEECKAHYNTIGNALIGGQGFATSVEVKKVEFHENEISDTDTGFYLVATAGAAAKLKDVKVNTNEIWDARFGVLVYAQNGRVESIEFKENAVWDPFIGFWIHPEEHPDGLTATVKGVKVEHNDIWNSTRDAILVNPDGPGTTVEDGKFNSNEITIASLDGIQFSAGADGGLLKKNEAKENLISDSAGDTLGIHLERFAADDLKIEKNDVWDVGRGLLVKDASGATVKENWITDALGVGITLDNATDNKFENNEVVGSGSHGMTIGASSDNEVKKNLFDMSGDSGIRLFESPSNLIDDNDVWNSGTHGIHLLDGDTDLNTIQKNVIDLSAEHGLFVEGGEDNLLKENEIDLNSNGAFVDARDDTSGGGTAGTANTWDKNKCDTSSPPGLCTG